jgi:hypothetical protein
MEIMSRIQTAILNKAELRGNFSFQKCKIQMLSTTAPDAPNSNKYKPKWHRSQCFGKKCTGLPTPLLR